MGTTFLPCLFRDGCAPPLDRGDTMPSERSTEHLVIRGGHVTDSFEARLRVSMHKGECASDILEAILRGRERALSGGFDASKAYRSLPIPCVHVTLVLLELLHDAYDDLDMSDDDIREMIPRQVAYFVTRGNG